MLDTLKKTDGLTAAQGALIFEALKNPIGFESDVTMRDGKIVFSGAFCSNNRQFHRIDYKGFVNDVDLLLLQILGNPRNHIRGPDYIRHCWIFPNDERKAETFWRNIKGAIGRPYDLSQNAAFSVYRDGVDLVIDPSVINFISLYDSLTPTLSGTKVLHNIFNPIAEGNSQSAKNVRRAVGVVERSIETIVDAMRQMAVAQAKIAYGDPSGVPDAAAEFKKIPNRYAAITKTATEGGLIDAVGRKAFVHVVNRALKDVYSARIVNDSTAETPETTKLRDYAPSFFPKFLLQS